MWADNNKCHIYGSIVDVSADAFCARPLGPDALTYVACFGPANFCVWDGDGIQQI